MRFEHWIYIVRLRLRSLFHRKCVEQELDEEFRFHLEQREAQEISAGKTIHDARYAAIHAMQGIEQHKEQCRDARRVNFTANLLQDLRYGLRNLARPLGFTVIAILTLALGIGANSAVFSVVNAALLRPLPYPKPDQLMLLFEKDVLAPGGGPNIVSFANFRDWQSQSHSLIGMAAGREVEFNLGGSGAFPPERISGAIYSWGLSKTLGIQPVFGRPFTILDDRSGATHVAIISYGLWQRRFGGTRDILHRNIRLDGVSYSIIGVMPRGFAYPAQETEIWVPIEQILTPLELQSRGSHELYVLARVRDGMTVAQATAEVNAIQQRILAKNPRGLVGRGAIGLAPRDTTTSESKTSLYVLLAAVGCLLLIACVNISNLMLARGAQRSREFSIRTALGASRFRVLQQVLTESMLLAALSAVAGLLLAYGLTEALAAYAPLLIQNMGGIETSAHVQIDSRVLVFTMCVSLLTGICAGLLPARRSALTDTAAGLKEGGRTVSGSHRQQRLRHLLVGVEVALSVLLLIAAGLMIRSFFALRSVNPGVRIQNILTAGISLPATHYNNREQVSHFAQALLERLRGSAGVESAGLVTVLPVGGYWSDNTFQIEGHPLPPGQFNLALNRAASPGYFRAAGIPLVAGRAFTDHDGSGFDDIHPRESTVIISESMAKKFWPEGNALDARIYFDESPRAARYRVIGIVGDVLIRLGDHIQPMMYTPLFEGADPDFYALVHTTGNPAIVAPEVPAAVKGLDSDVPAFQVRTMADVVGESAKQRAFTALLFASFAGLALLLSAVGLYGVLAYLVSQRSSEMGIRMALGAGRSDIWRLVLVQGLRPALAGTAAGLVAALGLVRVLHSLLFGVTPMDPLTFASVALLLLSVAVLACIVPAFRAVRLDPASTLRTE